MAMEARSPSPFTGQWQIVSMEQWDENFINDGHIQVEFGEDDHGLIRFGCVYGNITCWLTARHGKPTMEWCWEGSSKKVLSQRQGWAVLKGDELHGVILLHGGNASFVAERRLLNSTPRRPK